MSDNFSTLTLTLSLSHTHTHTLSLSHTNTHTHTLTHALTHTKQDEGGLALAKAAAVSENLSTLHLECNHLTDTAAKVPPETLHVFFIIKTGIFRRLVRRRRDALGVANSERLQRRAD